MSKYRRAARTDDNQEDIVKDLRGIPGVTVQPGMDDILVGFRGKTFWFEIKNPDKVSKKSKRILESAIKQSQKVLRATWTGHYSIVSSIGEIQEELNIEISENKTSAKERKGFAAVDSKSS